jgi:hypothetical protein
LVEQKGDWAGEYCIGKKSRFKRKKIFLIYCFPWNIISKIILKRKRKHKIEVFLSKRKKKENYTYPRIKKIFNTGLFIIII